VIRLVRNDDRIAVRYMFSQLLGDPFFLGGHLRLLLGFLGTVFGFAHACSLMCIGVPDAGFKHRPFRTNMIHARQVERQCQYSKAVLRNCYGANPACARQLLAALAVFIAVARLQVRVPLDLCPVTPVSGS